ncbi:glycosyltransferase [Roseobacter sinensis]|uniref:Glycosyltransferase n=1 Tax=Roseobacter sinensis TaxID=2931391 RepID=A0ABT3BK55_9RHOB|nr:glycosyltransferase [Roseobacter sp. WL0113]MCV3273958.1 glycosyltransferase [Roseobacter sp. WL0113]
MSQLPPSKPADLKVAIVHYWLVGMRGGEKVLEALCEMFPRATIYTHVCDPAKISAPLRRHRIELTRIGRLPFATRLYQSYLPLMPRALEELDLSGYDLVLSSEAGPAKGVIAPPGVPHLCYCHSPMRYIWDQYHVYRAGAGVLTRAAMPLLAHRMRIWDVTSAARVDDFIANSAHVAKRIEKYWRRPATVVHPPVDLPEPFAPKDPEAFYLLAGELASYKRPELAVAAFTRMGKPLVVAGGPASAERHLRKIAGPTISFRGRVDDATFRDLMARCKALIFPGEEDFGMIPVEVMGAGRPVIALGRGGALETGVPGETGLFFDAPTVESLVAAVTQFEAQGLDRLDPAALRAHAAQFDRAAFQRGIAARLERFGLSWAPPARAS